jgi:hypothetical protein
MLATIRPTTKYIMLQIFKPSLLLLLLVLQLRKLMGRMNSSTVGTLVVGADSLSTDRVPRVPNIHAVKVAVAMMLLKKSILESDYFLFQGVDFIDVPYSHLLEFAALGLHLINDHIFDRIHKYNKIGCFYGSTSVICLTEILGERPDLAEGLPEPAPLWRICLSGELFRELLALPDLPLSMVSSAMTIC